jgi:hypothetical protein
MSGGVTSLTHVIAVRLIFYLHLVCRVLVSIVVLPAD